MTSTSAASIKLRSVCDVCTASKVKCDGQTPCGRCARKGLLCHYRPFRHQSSSSSSAPGTTASKHHLQEELTAAPGHGLFFFEEYERKTWSVFFSLYKKLMRGPNAGCSSVWYNAKLANMQHFLKLRADQTTLERFNQWVDALGVTIHPLVTAPIPVSSASTPVFPQLMDSLKRDATARELPMIEISALGKVTCNSAVQARFACTAQELQHILDESAGGFLPYGADVVARLVCRERDLVTYIQMVSLNIDSLGKPESLPSTRCIPCQAFVHVQARRGEGAGQFSSCPCIVRSVYVEQIESMLVKSFTYVLVFELGEPFPNQPVAPPVAVVAPPPVPVVVPQQLHHHQLTHSPDTLLPFADLAAPPPPPAAAPAPAALPPATADDDDLFERTLDEREAKRHQQFDDDLLDDAAWLDTLLGDDDDFRF